MDSSGNYVWCKIYGGEGYDAGYDVEQTSDGGFIIIGKYSKGTDFDVWLLKTDQNGDTLWTKTYGGSGYDSGSSIEIVSDKGFVISGFVEYFDGGGANIYLIRTDSLGNLLWTKSTEIRSFYSGKSVQIAYDNGYIVGSAKNGDGYLAKLESDLLTDVGDIENISIPNNLISLQNFPNPFNPTTKIKYTIPDVGTGLALSIKLKVYDILGNEIVTLVNEDKPSGSYEVEFNTNGHSDAGQNLSSGVYYYQLKAGGQVLTRKMILMK